MAQNKELELHVFFFFILVRIQNTGVSTLDPSVYDRLMVTRMLSRPIGAGGILSKEANQKKSTKKPRDVLGGRRLGTGVWTMRVLGGKAWGPRAALSRLTRYERKENRCSCSRGPAKARRLAGDKIPGQGLQQGLDAPSLCPRRTAQASTMSLASSERRDVLHDTKKIKGLFGGPQGRVCFLYP